MASTRTSTQTSTRTSTRTIARLTAGRRISTRTNDQVSADGYFSRIVKYVPTEFLTVFLVISSLVDSGLVKVTADQYWLIFAALLVANAIYLFFATRQNGMPPAIRQIAVSTVLFAAFIYAVGGPFHDPRVSLFYSEDYGAILLPVALFLAGFVVPNPVPVGAKTN
jgi:hypothetical protein